MVKRKILAINAVSPEYGNFSIGKKYKGFAEYNNNESVKAFLKDNDKKLIEIDLKKREFNIEIDDTKPMSEMDELEWAMTFSPHFAFIDNEKDPKIVLYGRSYCSSSYSNGITEKEYHYEIGENWNDNSKNFSIHYIRSYEDVKKWLDKNTEKGYEYYLNLYKNSDLCEFYKSVEE